NINTLFMKTIILISLFLTTSLSFGQKKFNYDQSGLNLKYVVVDIPQKTQQELFTKSINWIKETYKNPDKVIKTTIENKKIRFEGVDMDIISTSALGLTTYYPTTYVIEIAFKDGKYKFEPISIEYRIPSSAYNPTIIENVDLTTGKKYYNRKG